MRKIETMTEIAPNIFRASEKCLYIRLPTGELKFCSQERYEKLLTRHSGNTDELVAKYRTRQVAVPLTKEQRVEALKKELAALENG